MGPTDIPGKAGTEENPPPEIDFHATYKPLATPVTAEVYVTKILNRDEFDRPTYVKNPPREAQAGQRRTLIPMD